MGYSALELCQEAYRKLNLIEVPLSTFSVAEYPFSYAKEALNTTIRKLNSQSSFEFMLTETSLLFSEGVKEYDLNALDVQPQRIKLILDKENNAFIPQKEWVQFTQEYGHTEHTAGMVDAFTKIGTTLRLNRAPDRDYSLVLYHYKPLPLAQTEVDTFPWPTEYEDVVIDGICAHVSHSLGREDAKDYFAFMRDGASRFISDQRTDFGLPRVMPRSF